MKKIAIIGAGGFGREVKMLIDHINQKKVNSN
ncbi:PglD-related sugar-binding protein [Chryseobacterium bernardetii]